MDASRSPSASPVPHWQPGRRQAAILLTAACASVLGSLLIAPVLPELERAFAGTPGVDTLAPMAMTLPALGIAVLGPLAGSVTDRFGRTRLLFGAMPAYAVLGTAPLWLDSLPLILLSRALLGVVEAAVMTVALTLLGDYFTGARRDRYMTWHSVITSVAAVGILAVGGGLGAAGWRTPFWLYAAALPLLGAMVVLLREPSFDRAAAGLADRQVTSLPWRALAPLLVLTVVGAACVFFVLQVQLGFVLDDLGVGSAGIGASAAIANAGVVAGSLCFVRWVRDGAGRLLVAAFVVGGLGLMLVTAGHGWVAVTGGGFVSGVGCGLMLPSLLIGTTSRLAFDQRGRGTAAWTSAFYLGQFLSPVAVGALGAAVGGLAHAIRFCAVGGLLAGLAAIFVLRRRPLAVSGQDDVGCSGDATRAAPAGRG
ncbi:MFS transporter [Streptomyces cylindrosporus]|uniref:MFS transporter n=1 Tax=Streptomyces cylindrosporus TaxID=2927583 RepID=A0ABS9Y0L4_9ACTN|nr:MFS transporter [Streptomyces cylindrosporus]MCI3270752.1 MFS transporter [Streptomyces cylindrosporus]